MKGKLRDISGKNTGKESEQERQDRILRETAERYGYTNELHSGEFREALEAMLPIGEQVRILRIKAGLSIQELTEATGVNIEALEAGDKDNMRVQDTIKVFEYLDKLNG